MTKEKKGITIESKKLNKQKEENKTLSEELLTSYRGALYKMKEFFDSIKDFDVTEDVDKTMKVMDSILKCGEKLGKNIETLSVLEKKVASDEGVNSKVRGSADLGQFE
jgi:hypothetical protein